VRTVRPNQPEPAREATLELLDLHQRPTAVLAMSDILAIGALQAAAEAKVAVPEALSVVGFDDSPVAQQATPPLTTVAQPHEEKGRLAAQLLVEEVERGEGPSGRSRSEILPTDLVVRASTAPPPE
jgi:DNA-binding LacI/PurR family transcriptional regulator